MIKFSKMHGNGNDYVYTQNFNDELKGIDISDLARNLSNRNFAVGSDGLIYAEKSDIADFKMVMYNADGSKGAMCGNGIRCLAKYVYDNGFFKKNHMTVETDSGIKNLEIDYISDILSYVRVDMGFPILKGRDIPVALDAESVFDHNLSIGGYDILINAVSMGNPHAVIFIDELDTELKNRLIFHNKVTHKDISFFSKSKLDILESFDIKSLGKMIQGDRFFIEGVNVEIVKVLDKDNIAMRVYERGSAETLSCGTGCCAVAVVAIKKGLVNNTVNVHTLGGTLNIEWSGTLDGPLFMSGFATKVFDGELVENFDISL